MDEFEHNFSSVAVVDDQSAVDIIDLMPLAEDLEPKGIQIGLSGKAKFARYDLALEQVDTSNLIECFICGEHFGGQESLGRHVQMAHVVKEEGKFKCKFCPLKLKNEQRRKKHIQDVHSGSERFECGQCGSFFNKKRSLRNHSRMFHASSTAGVTKQYSRRDKKEKVFFRCHDCPYTTGYKRNMTRHCKAKHGTTPIALDLSGWHCDKCQRGFSRKGNLTRHIKTGQCGAIQQPDDSGSCANMQSVCE